MISKKLNNDDGYLLIESLLALSIVTVIVMLYVPFVSRFSEGIEDAKMNVIRGQLLVEYINTGMVQRGYYIREDNGGLIVVSPNQESSQITLLSKE